MTTVGVELGTSLGVADPEMVGPELGKSLKSEALPVPTSRFSPSAVVISVGDESGKDGSPPVGVDPTSGFASVGTTAPPTKVPLGEAIGIAGKESTGGAMNPMDGASLGAKLGISLGSEDRTAVGDKLGMSLGVSVGLGLGAPLGISLGNVDGLSVGEELGISLGN